MEISYTTGPRYIDGVNIDADVNASIPAKEVETSIHEPVTNLTGKGYQPGQQNKDGSPL